MAKKKRPPARQRKGPKKTAKKNRLHKPKRQPKPSKKQQALRRQRSVAARKGWETRRRRELEEAFRWQRWIFEHRINVTATLLYAKPNSIRGKSGDARIRRDAKRLLEAVRGRYPHARLYGGCILYKRSSDGKRWDDGIVTKYLDWKAIYDDALALFVSQAGAFYNDLTNPDRLLHAYKVKIVGLAARGMLKKTATPYREGDEPTIPGIITESRTQRRRRQLGRA